MYVTIVFVFVVVMHSPFVPFDTSSVHCVFFVYSVVRPSVRPSSGSRRHITDENQQRKRKCFVKAFHTSSRFGLRALMSIRCNRLMAAGQVMCPRIATDHALGTLRLGSCRTLPPIRLPARVCWRRKNAPTLDKREWKIIGKWLWSHLHLRSEQRVDQRHHTHRVLIKHLLDHQS